LPKETKEDIITKDFLFKKKHLQVLV